MPTTLNIDEKILAEVVEATGEKPKSKAANMALEQFIRQKTIKNLLSMAGQLEINDVSGEQAVLDKQRAEYLEKLLRGESRLSPILQHRLRCSKIQDHRLVERCRPWLTSVILP